jgi:hypothetical protein
LARGCHPMKCGGCDQRRNNQPPRIKRHRQTP